MNINLNNLVPVSEIQKNYRKIFDRVKRTRQPIILMRDSEADIALIDTKSLADLQKTREQYEALLDAMSDANLEKEIKEAEDDTKNGRAINWEKFKNKLCK
jgi:PHD/YefM family antitoxin component YafN of YafNO toxin-antitoxin module